MIKRGQELKKMNSGDCFGEHCLRYETTRNCSVKAISNVVCLTLQRKKLSKILGGNVDVVIHKNMIMNCLNQSSYLSQINISRKEKIASNMIIQAYEKGFVLFPAGKSIDQLVCILEGNLIDVNQRRNLG